MILDQAGGRSESHNLHVLHVILSVVCAVNFI